MTGATGFVGRHVLGPIVELGYDVHAVHHRASPIEVEGVTWHRVDLLEEDIPIEASHLLHLAWYAVPRKFWSAPENLRWVEASLRLLRRFAAGGGGRAVVAGTCAEYDWSAGHCVEGVTPLAPIGVYGTCKNALRELLEATPGLSSAWGRIFFLYGPFEPPEKLVASVIRALLAGEEVRLSAGAQRRDFLYVADAGAAFARLLDSAADGAVNIGSGQAVAVRDVAERIGRLIGRPELLRFGEPGNEPPLVVADVGRLREEVGLEPRFALDPGLAQTIEWWRERA